MYYVDILLKTFKFIRISTNHAQPFFKESMLKIGKNFEKKKSVPKPLRFNSTWMAFSVNKITNERD